MKIDQKEITQKESYEKSSISFLSEIEKIVQNNNKGAK
jgi:hypothetical protein